ncbi:MAG: hypothetical protein QM628_15700 [Propionicimonas sp.]
MTTPLPPGAQQQGKPFPVTRIRKTSIDLWTADGWLTVPVDTEAEAQELTVGINDHLNLEGIDYSVTVNVSDTAGVREAWFEQSVSPTDVARATEWPLWITNKILD